MQIEEASKKNFDVIIIGGGATGAGIALDATLRGLKVILFEKKEKLSGEIKILKDKILERQKTIESENKKLVNFSKLDSDIKLSEKRLDEIDKKIEEFVKKIEHKKTLVDRSKQDIKDIELKKKKIEDIGPNAKCPTCERVLSDQFKTLLKKYDEDLTKKKKEILTFTRDIKKHEEDKDRIFREEQAFHKKKNYLQVQLREKERIDTTIKNLQNEINNEKIELKRKADCICNHILKKLKDD